MPAYDLASQLSAQGIATAGKGIATAASNLPIASNINGVRTAPSTFEQDFYKIQLAAARLVAIQEKAKQKGSLTAEDNKIYADSLIELGQAAQSLAKLQQTGQIQDFSLLFQPTSLGSIMPQKEPPPLAPNISNINSSTVAMDSTTIGDQKGEEATEHQLNGDDLLPPNLEDPYEDVNDSVAITAPKKDASVAEAKPIGLSIAGEGGVASSKPNAVALSGRNGLAVSAPKATAIAGVSPEEAAAFSVSLPSRNHLVLKNTPAPLKERIESHLLEQGPSFEDYDYVDFTPVRSLPPTRGVNSHLRKKPTNEKISLALSKSSAGDAFVNKWKTLVAEDYAAGPSYAEHSAQPKLRLPSKFQRFH